MSDQPFIGDRTKAKQRLALLEALKIGPISTIEARERLGIERAAARIFEARKLGFDITTARTTVADAAGRLHTTALYWLNQSNEAAP